MIKKAKAESWEKFVGSINNNTTTKELYNKMGKLSGKSKNNSVKALEVRGENITNPQKIVDLLARSFSMQTSNESYVQPFKDKKQKRDKLPVKVNEDDGQDYNENFSAKSFVSFS